MEVLSRNANLGYHQRSSSSNNFFHSRHRPHSCALYGMPNYSSGGDQVPRSQFADDRNLYFGRPEYANGAGGGGENSTNVDTKAGLYSDQNSFLQSSEHYAQPSVGPSMMHAPVTHQHFHQSQRHEQPQQHSNVHMPATASSQPQWQLPKKVEQTEQRTPRPSNAWIIYRSQKFRELQQERDSQARSAITGKPRSQAVISRIISQMWANETPAVKQEFEALADAKKLEHQRMYPNYRYRPRKKVKSASSNNVGGSSDLTARNSVSPNSTSGRSNKSGALGSSTSSYGESSMEVGLQQGYGHGSPVRRPLEAGQRFSDASAAVSAGSSMRDSFYQSYPQPVRRPGGDVGYASSSSRMNAASNVNSQYSQGLVGSRIHAYGDRADAQAPVSTLSNSAYYQSSSRYIHAPTVPEGNSTTGWHEASSTHGENRHGEGYSEMNGTRGPVASIHVGQNDQQLVDSHQHQQHFQHHHPHQHHQRQAVNQHEQQLQHQQQQQQPQGYVQQPPAYPGSAGADYASNLSSDSGYSMASRTQNSASTTPQTYPQYPDSSEVPSGLPGAASGSSDYVAPRRSQIHVYYKSESF